MYPYAGDRRIPLREVHALFKGSGSTEKVLAAAGRDQSDKLKLRNHLCYAHLYLGLYYEALGETGKAAEHMKKAAVDYKMDHYMGKVAQIHHNLRTGKKQPVRQ
jgi:lipoprotein NlpI